MASASQVTSYRGDLDQALNLLRETERLADRQRRRQAALRTRDDLARAEASVRERRGELAAATRAAEVAPALAEAERTAAALTQARAAEERARTAADAEPGVGAAALRDAAEQHMTRYGRLEALRSVSRQADDEDQTATAARTAATALTAQIDVAGQDLDARRRQRPERGRERDQAAEAGQRGPAVRAEADRYRRAADDASALVKALADKSRQERAWSSAKLDAAELIMKAARLREARIDGMRAELAATLVDGAPCPVCGSPDHPELCELQGERVTREQEEAADAEAAAATDQAELTGARLGAADERVNDLSARLREAGFTDAADMPQAEVRQLDTTARDLAAQAGKLAAAAASLGDVQAALDALDRSIADTEKRIVELTEQREAELRQAADAGQRSAGHRQALLAQLDGHPDLDKALAAARAAADALTAAANAADTTARAARDAARADDMAARAAADAGFDGLDAVRKAVRDAAWRAGRPGHPRARGLGRGRRRAADRSRP